MTNQEAKRSRVDNDISYWNDESVDEALSAAADNHDRMLEKMNVQRRKRDLLNERYRLLDEVVYPLTRSHTKHVAVGVKPLEDYTPVMRIGNAKLSAAAIFTLEEANELFGRLKEIVAQFKPKVDGEQQEEKFLGRLMKYNLHMCKYQNVIFKSNDPIDVYDSIFISITTIKTMLGLQDHIMDLLSARRIKYGVYPPLNVLINTVALQIMESDTDRNSVNLVDLVFRIINDDNERNQTLYEFFLKLPATFKYQVDEKLDYWNDRNDYNNL